MGDDPAEIDEVRRRLQELQRRKRGGIRWQIGRHTAEMAIDALESPRKTWRPHGKQRRRKRWKRLL
jgi:hypothetical protein